MILRKLTNFIDFNFLILQNVFLEIWKIQQKTIKNVNQLCMSENSAETFTINHNCQ